MICGGYSLKQIKQIFLEGESPSLKSMIKGLKSCNSVTIKMLSNIFHRLSEAATGVVL